MTYTCPMHREIRQDTPGKCPKCGMDLVPEESLQKQKKDKVKLSEYKPLFIIVGLIALSAFAGSWYHYSPRFSPIHFMGNFMAGFFLVFSGFKLLDIGGFAEGYSQYDLLAKHWKGYGYIYPFIELALGLLYFHIPTHPTLNFFTFILMTFSGIGVAIKVAKREKFQCACLGTFIKVPLTTVTIVEDFGMALMALLMLVMGTV